MAPMITSALPCLVAGSAIQLRDMGDANTFTRLGLLPGLPGFTAAVAAASTLEAGRIS